MSFEDKDHFSGHADRYEAFRPTYPDALFLYLSSLCTRHDLGWDCATGNGQAAVALAPYFSAIIATDASQKQIDHARPRANVQYRIAPADGAPLADASVDLVTVAQALHWFSLPRFYAEVLRVAKPDGLIAVLRTRPGARSCRSALAETTAIKMLYYSRRGTGKGNGL